MFREKQFFTMSPISATQKKHYTFQEYLKLEQREHIRYEYFKGEVFAMAGASLNHGDIVSNINSSLRGTFRSRGCRSFQESYKLELLDNDYYVYPDVILTCDGEDLQSKYVIKHPVLIAEVFSPSTESFDRKVKYKRYARLASLKYLLFVAQERPFVELFSRPNVFIDTYAVAGDPTSSAKPIIFHFVGLPSMDKIISSPSSISELLASWFNTT